MNVSCIDNVETHFLICSSGTNLISMIAAKYDISFMIAGILFELNKLHLFVIKIIITCIIYLIFILIKAYHYSNND